MTGLYDHQGVLRFSGRDSVECLEYAELFCLAAGSYILAILEKHDPVDPPLPLCLVQDVPAGAGLVAQD